MLFHVEQNAVSRETTIALADPTGLNQEKLLIRSRKMLFHVEQDAVSRETDLIRTECVRTRDRFERSVIRMAPASWLAKIKKAAH